MIMIKKQYIQPVAERVEFAPCSMLASSPNSGSGVLGGGDDNDFANGDGSDQLSIRHRGEWGNLWK